MRNKRDNNNLKKIVDRNNFKLRGCRSNLHEKFLLFLSIKCKALIKSKLLLEIESQVDTVPPKRIDIALLDAFFILHLIKRIPPTFGQLARKILIDVCQYKAKTIHVVFDKHVGISIKDVERDIRRAVNVPYRIEGPAQVTPGNWELALKNGYFKIELVRFLIGYWAENHLASIIGDKIFFVNYNDVCFSFNAYNGVVVKIEEMELYNTHEEADNGIVYHLTAIQQRQKDVVTNIVVRTRDTDILVILLGCKDMLDPRLHIWMEVGQASLNDLRYTEINKVYNTLGRDVCLALLAFHAFTGCDYDSAFCRRGKVNPFRQLRKNPDAIRVFGKLCCIVENNCDISYEDFLILQNFVCKMYGQGKVFSVNQARVNCFFKKFKPNKKDKLLSCSNKFDSTVIPPCEKVLKLKLLRTIFIARR